MIKEDHKEIRELLPKIWEYLRKSLIIMILLEPRGINKKALVKQIDQALIDNQENENLIKKINATIQDIDLCFKA